jgi:thioredoxin 1
MIASIGEQTFKEDVLSSPTPVLVTFWTPWCGPCRMIEPLLVQLKDNDPHAVKVFKVNADDNFWLTKTYKLTSIPTLLLFHKGNLVHRLENVNGREDILKPLKQALEGLRRSPFEETAKTIETSRS